MVNQNDLRGIKTPAAFQVLFTLLIGYFQVPVLNQMIDFEKFVDTFDKAERAEKEEILRKAVTIVPLTEEELLNVLYFARDVNGVRFTRENIDNLKYDEILKLVVDVCLAFAETKVFF